MGITHDRKTPQIFQTELVELRTGNALPVHADGKAIPIKVALGTAAQTNQQQALQHKNSLVELASTLQQHLRKPKQLLWKSKL